VRRLQLVDGKTSQNSDEGQDIEPGELRVGKEMTLVKGNVTQHSGEKNGTWKPNSTMPKRRP